MKKMSKFVSSLAFFGIMIGVACSGSHRSASQVDAENQRASIAEGNDKLRESSAIQAQLVNKYQIDLSAIASGKALDANGLIQFPWRRLRKSQRRDIQGLIAHYLQLINRVLEIDSIKDITIDNRELVLGNRDAAEIVQKSIEKFEALNGESFDPVADQSLRPPLE